LSLDVRALIKSEPIHDHQQVTGYCNQDQEAAGPADDDSDHKPKEIAT
jgi:hypothetical protein